MARLFQFQAESLPSWWDGNYRMSWTDTNLDLIRDDGAAQVVIVPTVFMDTLTSSTVYRDNSDPGAIDTNGRPRTESDASIRHVIADVKARGMDVVFKPHLDTQKIEWRALIAPQDINKWFATYKDAMVHYAALAQEAGAKALSIGCELESLSGPAYRDKWIEVIQAVRQVYKGPLTYSATWAEALKVGFWDQVDYIGANPYISFTNSKNPTLQELVDGWTKPSTVAHVRQRVGDKPVMDVLRDLALSKDKPLIFTETGFRSMDGNNAEPWSTSPTGTIDQREQADMFEAFFKIMTAQQGDWLAGYWLWNYDAGTTVSDPKPDNGYYTHGKLADAVVEHYLKMEVVVEPTPGPGEPPAPQPPTPQPPAPQPPSSQSLAGDDVIIGTNQADAIDAMGGHDTIEGLGGNDILIGGAGNDVIDGGKGADRLYGLDGADRLRGGDGKDLLHGGAGKDVFVFDVRLTRSNIDVLKDFTARDDAVWLENSLFRSNKALFKAIKKGTEESPTKLGKGFFTVGSEAKDGDDFFILDRKARTLSYDPDGDGGTGEVVVARFGSSKAVKDFTINDLFFI